MGQRAFSMEIRVLLSRRFSKLQMTLEKGFTNCIALAVLLHKKIVLLSFLCVALYKFNTLLGKTWGENINWDVSTNK